MSNSSSKKVVKLKLVKNSELAIFSEESIYCDFCGSENTQVFTSSFDDRRDGDCKKNEMQICHNCVIQLSKLLPQKREIKKKRV